MAFVLKFLFKSLSKKRLPQTSGKISFSSIKDKVEILRDKWGIPHIYANSDEDLAFAIGFVHAQDRLWQMELYRRTASGTLSEIFGEVAIDTDRTSRTFGFRRLGIADFNALSPDVQKALESYAAGVNAFLQHPSTKLPLEFTLIKHVPQPWSAHDSMAFARLMLWQLNGQFSLKMARGQVLGLVGEEKFKELEFGYPGLNPFVVPQGIDCNAYEGGVLRAIKGPFIKKGGGSNSWAVAGSLTTTGKPIHCSDPHLGPSLPSIWYMLHIHSPNYNVYGVCPPVMPMVLIGHNAHISWGFTVASVDAEDLFIEKMNPDNPMQYEFQGKWCDAKIIEEKIMVKGVAEPVIEKVIVTRHGPIISDVVEHSHEKIALSSTALHPSTIVQGMKLLNQAENWDEFVAAVKLVIGLNQNICYADVDGNIGSYVCGRAPIRAKGDGSIPVPGWTGEYEWTGEIPFEEMPHSLNPSKNYVVCSNNLPADPKKYKYYLSKFADPGYRARRISEYIEDKPKIAPEDFMALHMDLKCFPGLDFIKKLDKFENSTEAQNPDVQLALKLLKAWDGNFTTNSIGGTVYEVTHNQLFVDIFEPVLKEKLTRALIGEGFHPLFKNTNEAYHGNTLLLFSLLDRPESWWIQQAGGVNALLAKSLQKAVQWLRENLNSDPNKWHWGALNKIVYPHAMAMQKPLDKVFNVGPLPMAGNKHTVCQIGSPIGTYAEKAWAPSYRQIVNMADLSKSYVVFPPGQSGNLASPHYRDLFELWYKGQYIPMLWTPEQIEANLEGKLELTPN